MQFESFTALKKLFEAQGNRRWSIAQTTAKERIAKLQKLRAEIVRRQEEFYTAIWEDFHKPRFEAWLCEVFPAIEEIDCAINHLEEWIRDKSEKWLYFLPTTKSRLHYEPKGRCLIFAPWNYPFLLLISPIVSAIAAGNTVIAKPSHKTPRVSAFLASLLEKVFEANEVAVIEGAGAEVGDELLKLPFDHVFFTGSPKVGAHVAELAVSHHASVTLELGGKSPVIILPDIATDVARDNNGSHTREQCRALKDAAEKIAWGKMLNAGQTCIAPDYVLCLRDLVPTFAEAAAAAVQKMYGETDELRKASTDLVHIIDENACSRHQKLLADAVNRGATPILSGEFDIENRYTPATILTNVTPDMEVMQSEIFGPILPILAYDTLDEAISFVQNRPKPLSLYVFGKSQLNIDKVLRQTTAGSTCINNCIIQIENLDLPFGGVGMSGTGNYHGFYGFRAFSHERNVMEQGFFDAVRLFHPPYKTKGLQTLSQKILKFLKKF